MDTVKKLDFPRIVYANVSVRRIRQMKNPPSCEWRVIGHASNSITSFSQIWDNYMSCLFVDTQVALKDRRHHSPIDPYG